MTIELRMLLYSVLLGLAHLIAASHFISSQCGYRWTAGNREQEMPALKGIVGRVDRGVMNFLETSRVFRCRLTGGTCRKRSRRLDGVGSTPLLLGPRTVHDRDRLSAGVKTSA